ncbi:MAG: hypothetical protein ACOCRX_10110, partial [Candidatus Woesearchaeota archaeon]
ISQMDYKKYMQLDFMVDLIAFDLPLIPLPDNIKLPYGFKRILNGGPLGTIHTNRMITESPFHLRRNGSLYFVIPDFDNQQTLDLMNDNGLEPKIVSQKRYYLSDTILTASLRNYIENKLDYNFHSGSKGDYFKLQAIQGIKRAQ